MSGTWPPEKLDAQKSASARLGFLQFLKLLLPVQRVGGLTSSKPGHRARCNPRLPRAVAELAW
jgi:hypothetical protein